MKVSSSYSTGPLYKIVTIYFRTDIVFNITLILTIWLDFVKGLGPVPTYFLTGKEGFTKELPSLNLAASLEDHEFKWIREIDNSVQVYQAH